MNKADSCVKLLVPISEMLIKSNLSIPNKKEDSTGAWFRQVSLCVLTYSKPVLIISSVSTFPKLSVTLVKFAFCILLSKLPALLMKSTKIDGVQRFITETTINNTVHT